MPWLPELFSAPALAQLEARRRERIVNIPYFDGLATGEVDALVESFAGEPRVQHPLRGTIEGEYDFREFVAATARWLKEHEATVEDLRRCVQERRGFEEVVVRFGNGSEAFGLPHAMVADHSPDGHIEEIRVYFSTRALTGHGAERPPILAADPALPEPRALAGYEGALAAGDAAAVAAAFEDDGYAREPGAADGVHRGGAAVRAFFADQLAGGGIELEHCAMVEEGGTCAVEYNAGRREEGAPAPQAGLTVFESGAGGKIAAARLYADLAPPAG